MRSHDLPGILDKILLATLAAAPAGCGIDTDGFEAVACGEGFMPSAVQDLSPAAPFDYIELRTVFDDVDDGEPNVIQSAGTPCASATDAAACEAAIAAATSSEGFELGQCVLGCNRYQYLVNRGDEVEVVGTLDGVLALLGAIDTPNEAVLRAGMAGYHVPCEDVDKGGVKAVGDGFEVLATRITSGCDPVEITLYRVGVTADATVSELESDLISSESGSCAGRRPSCFEQRRAPGTSQLGAYFASVAHLEDAAVHAFAEVRAELEHHGAPASLIARAERSRQDEIRHTAIMRRLAIRFGGTPPRAARSQRPPRSLEAMAMTNAVEGCVRETFGALVGMYQAEKARDARVRAIMQRIARDETRHAALSWDIDRWARTQLAPAAVARIDRARAKALRDLAREAEATPHPELVERAGLPSAAAHRELVERLVASIA